MKKHPPQKHEIQAPTLAVRDRVLAYLYQLDAGPVESLEIALKALETPDAAEPAQAFQNLFALVKERGLNREEAAEFALAAQKMLPPLNRQTMVSEGLNISALDFLSRIVTGGFRPLKNKDA